MARLLECIKYIVVLVVVVIGVVFGRVVCGDKNLSQANQL